MTTSRSPLTVVGWILTSTLLVTGCGAGPATSGTRETPTHDAPSAASPTPTPTPTDPVDLVASVEVGPADLPPGFGPDVMQEGDEVDGQVTLDLCGATFASEGLRTARHQVAYRLGDPESPGYDPAADRASVMSEAVAYSAGGAEQAMREVRSAITTCPRGYVPAGIGGMPPMWTTLTEIPPRPDWQADHVAKVVRVKLESGESFRMAVIYQRRGDLLAMAYVMTAKRDRGVALAREMASLLSDRLDAVADPTGSNPTA